MSPSNQTDQNKKRTLGQMLSSLFSKKNITGFKVLFNDPKIIFQENDDSSLYPIYDHPLWRMGFEDGRQELPQSPNERYIRAHINSSWLKEVKKIEKEKATKVAVIERYRQKYEILLLQNKKRQSYFDHLWKHRNDNNKCYRKYSFSAALLFLLAAVIFIFAELNLSQNLVSIGFDFDPISAFFLSLGIAFFGIFFKFYFEKFVLEKQNTEQHFTSDENPDTQPLHALETTNPPSEDSAIKGKDSSSDKQNNAGCVAWFFNLLKAKFKHASNREPYHKKRFFSLPNIMFVLVVLTIVDLGVFRGHYFELEKNKTDTSLAKQMGLPQPQAPYQQAPIKNGQKTISTIKDWLARVGALNTHTFILLSLIFALISGLCFSLGWIGIERSCQYWGAKSSLVWNRFWLDRRCKKLELVKSEVAHINNMLYIHSNRMLEELREKWVGIYLHGYSRGRSKPEVFYEVDDDKDLYTLSENALKKELSKRFRSGFWKSSGP